MTHSYAWEGIAITRLALGTVPVTVDIKEEKSLEMFTFVKVSDRKIPTKFLALLEENCIF